MFRNFTKPAAFDKDSMLERQRAPDQTCSQALCETEAGQANAGSQPTSDKMAAGTAEIHVSHKKSSQQTARSNGSLTKKGGYTTSIYVNGSAPKRPPKAPAGRSQSHEQPHSNHSQSNGVLPSKSLSRPLSLQEERKARHDPSIHNRRSANIGSTQSLNDNQLSSSVIRLSPQTSQAPTTSQTPQTSQPPSPTNGHSDISQPLIPDVSSYPQNVELHTDHTRTSEGEDSVSQEPILTRPRTYSQTKYNVIPPPPPLTEPVFAGRRDVRNPTSVREKQIVSAKGTVRGFKNRVRAGIATFWAQPEDKRNYRQLEQGKIVIYGTSMSVVRETYDRCKIIRNLLQNHMVRYEERDLYMSREIQQELRHRLTQEGIQELRLPHVFADGIHIGGAEELEKLNEAGELRGLLDNYQKINVRIMCEKCGGYRFLPCEVCHGSKRSLLRNHFTEEFCALRCMHCDENGLKRCDVCKDQQE